MSGHETLKHRRDETYVSWALMIHGLMSAHERSWDTHDTLMIHSWCTHDALMTHSWYTHERSWDKRTRSSDLPSFTWSALEVVSSGCGPLLNSVSSGCGPLWVVISLCCGPLSCVVSLGWGPLLGALGCSWVLLNFIMVHSSVDFCTFDPDALYNFFTNLTFLIIFRLWAASFYSKRINY